MKLLATRNYERQTDKAFQFMNDNGEAVKKLRWTHFTYYEHHYSQSIINHYQYVVEKQPIIKL
jgi:hypothetical protein